MIVSALLLAFNVQLLGDPSAYAAESYDDLADGEYTFDTQTLTANTEEQSAAQTFLGKTVTLTIQDDQAFFTVEVPENPMASIDWMTIQGAEPVKKDGDKWTYQLNAIEDILQAEIEYQVPAMNLEHVVSFRFVLEGLEELPKAETPEVEEEPEVEQPEEETPEVEEPEVEQPDEEETPEVEEPEVEQPEDNETPETDENEGEGSEDEKPEEEESPEETTLSNGYYNITSAFLHATEDQASSMGRYLDENVFVHVQDEQTLLTISVNDHETVTKLQVNGQDAVHAKLNSNTRIETFAIDKLSESIDANVEYEAEMPGGKVHYGKAEFRIVMDVDSAEEVSKNEQPGADISAEYVQLQDGLYSVDTSFINIKNGKDSAMARYLDDLAYIEVKDGKAIVYLHVLDNGTVTKVQVNDTDTVEEIVNGDESLVGFTVDPLLTELAGYAEYQAPFGGTIHYGNADFNIEIDRNTVKEIKALPIEQEGKEEPQPEEKPEQEPEEKPEEKPVDDEEVQTSTIDYVIKHATADEASAADNFFVKPAKVVKENGKTYLEVTITSWSMIGSLKVNDQAVKVLKEDKKADTALVKFEVPNNLSTIVPLQMQVTVPGLYDTTHEARLVMDAKTLVEDGKPGKPETPSNPATPGQKPSLEKPEKPSKVDPNASKTDQADKVFNIDYVIKHATADERSAADNFFVKPGVLLEKNGKHYLQVQVTNWSMIDWLTVNGKSVTVIQEDKKADTATIQFEVPKNLSDIMKLSMKVTVPGLYETVHDARLVMNEKSLEEIENHEDFKIYEAGGMASGKGPNGSNDSNHLKDEDPLQKPSFGSNGTSNDEVKPSTTAGQSNPQTGDNSMIVLYTVLLLASSIALFVRFRKHQVHE